jgi:probable F420-dependent oxidoreductase
MNIGVSIFPTDKTIAAVDLAPEVEARGFESLWFTEHSHIPTSRETPWGGVEGSPELPEMYWRTHDQIVSIATSAVVTERIHLGTGISLVAQHDPLWLAKQVASVDVASNGRVLFGIGYGWNKEEMADHGVAYTDRRVILREKVLAMIELWTDDEPEFHGDFVDIARSWAWPKPVRRPYPPIYLGGAAGPRTMRDMVEFCDGWMPITTRHEVAGKVDQLRKELEAAGRDPESFELIAWQAPRDVDELRALAGLGFSRAIFGLPPVEPSVVLGKLDEYTKYVEALG